MRRAAPLVYRLLLLAYPRAFRDAFGAGMVRDFRRLLAAARGDGVGSAAWLWIRSAADMLRTGLAERTRMDDGLERWQRGWTTTTGGGDMLADLMQDLKSGLRTLRRSPGYALVVIGTLGLGIGVNTAMFSLVDGVLLAPLPYAQGERIVQVDQLQPGVGPEAMRFSVKEIQDYRARSHTLSDLVEYHNMTFTLLGLGEPELVQTGVVSAHYFDVLGMTPTLGRTFTQADDQLGAEPVMILSNEYWVRRLGADPDVLGRGYEMNGKVHTVIGVLPPIPQHPDVNDVYMPTSQCPTRSSDHAIETRAMRMMTVFGVLRRDATLPGAQRDLSGVASELARAYPDEYRAETTGYEVRVTPLKEKLVSRARPTLLILMGTAALVLLVACANVASLALARAVRQGQELALRQALGAGRGRLVRQLLTESTVLALVGGALGVALAFLGLDLLVTFAERFTPRALETSIDGPVLAFALVLSLVTGLFFGSVPALRRAARAGSTIGRGRASDVGPAGFRAHGWLVGTQVALALVLLIGAGLLARTFVAVSSVELGYETEGVLSASITLPMERYYMADDGPDGVFYDELIRRVAALPGVRSAARARQVPLDGGPGHQGMEAEDLPAQGPEDFIRVVFVRATPDYFETLRIPIVAGRGLTEEDRALPERSVVVSRSLAERVWGARDPIGLRVRSCSYATRRCGDWLAVVGVAGDVQLDGIESAATPVVYASVNQRSFGGDNLVIRADGDLTSLGRQLTEIVHQLEPDAPVSSVRTLDSYVADAVAPRRLTATLMGVFAGLALLVTLAGVGGVVAFTTSRRAHEIGVRLALGADSRTVLFRVVRMGMAPAIVGLLVGGAVSLGLSRVLAGLVWGVGANDWVSFVAGGAMLALGALFACWIPARRIMSVDPVSALRSD